MKQLFTFLFATGSILSFSQTCNLLNHTCNNTTGLYTSGITANAGSTYACTVGNYVLYSSGSGDPYIATDDLLVNPGNSATLHFQAKKSSGYTGTAEIWAHVGGYCSFGVYTSPFNTNGWVEIGSFNPTTSCAGYGPFTVPADIIGGNKISYCIVLKNASSTNWVSIDDICVSQIAGPAVPTTYTETFGTSSSGWYPAPGYVGIPYHTYKNASDAYVLLSTGETGGSDKAAYFYTGFDFCSTVSGTGITTREINTSGYTNGEVRISFKSRYPCSGTLSYTFDEDYTSYSPEVFIMEGPDDGSNTWIPLPVNYYFSDYTWRVASYDISAYQNANVRIKVERGGFCGTAMEAVDNIKVLDRNCAISLLSCGTITGETAPLPSTQYVYSVPAVAGAMYYKWFVRSGGDLYDAAPYIVSGQGTQNATIDFGTLPASGLRVLCIPYDADPAVVADACYAQIGYLGVTLTSSTPLTLDNTAVDNVTCFGDNDGSITLTVSGGTPSYTYDWVPNVSSTNSATNLSPGNYQITITDQNGEELIELVEITEPDLLTINGFSDTAVCEGETFTTSGVVTGGDGSYIFDWAPLSLSDPTQLNPVFMPVTGTTYNLLVLDGAGCFDVVSFVADVILLPVVDFGADQTVCPGEIVTLTAGTEPTSTYDWNTAETTSSIDVSTPGIYSVVVTDTFGCSAADDFELFNFTVSTIDLGGPYSFCMGETQLLDAGPGFVSYNWNSSDTTQTIIAASSGTYTVTATDTNVCQIIADAIIDAVAPPSVNLGEKITVCDDSLVLDAGAGYDAYLWSTADTTQTITVTTDGDYWVQVSEGPCERSDTVEVVFTDCAGISENDAAALLLYPNPVHAVLKLENIPLRAVIFVYDISGKLILTKESTDTSCSLDTEFMAPGVYTVVVSSEDKIIRKQFVRE